MNISPPAGRTFRDEIASIILDSTSSVPLHSQLNVSLRKLFSLKKWEGERLPAEGELAQILGVSVSTARQALTPLAAEKLIERRRGRGSFICAASKVKALSYITVIAPNYPSRGIALYIETIRRQAASMGAEIQLVEVNKGDDWKQLDAHLKYPPDEGAVLLLTDLPIPTFNLYSLLTEKGYRTVSIDNWTPNYPGDFVTCHDRSIVARGLKILTEFGHRRIVFLVAEPEEYDYVTNRVEAFEETAAQYGLGESRVFHCGIHAWDSAAQAATEAMATLWNEEQRPTAIFAISDGTALGVYAWMEANGYAAPHDISLLAIDAVELQSRVPQLSTFLKPVDSIIWEAFRLLKSPDGFARHLYLDSTLEAGETIARVV